MPTHYLEYGAGVNMTSPCWEKGWYIGQEKTRLRTCRHYWEEKHDRHHQRPAHQIPDTGTPTNSDWSRLLPTPHHRATHAQGGQPRITFPGLQNRQLAQIAVLRPHQRAGRMDRRAAQRSAKRLHEPTFMTTQYLPNPLGRACAGGWHNVADLTNCRAKRPSASAESTSHLLQGG